MDNLTTEQKETMRQLQNWGVSTEQAASLLTRFDVARIQRQIAWLPARRVKSPNGFLIAAIEGDYEAPRGLLPVKRTQTAPDEESDSGPAANPTP